ncbi:MAG: chromosomal replication initiator protein DnaA [Acidobacteria bacterium]|nr:chromosomal replication initiator protein DnaA [Acidobacteriota bacterium]MDW7983927.1 chromosomal replication initiator protein DnaA [Acidobacteriota bacterium]
MYWVKILQGLQRRLRPQSYNSWFRPTVQFYEDDRRVQVLIPSKFFREVIQRSYAQDIQACIQEAHLPAKELEFLTHEELERAHAREMTTDGGLNPIYTFENFVVGASNQAAHAASTAVADHPGHVYNPLFIYGGVGLGKTHLLHAIGNRTTQNRPDLRVIYVSCDALMNQLVEAYQRGNVHDLRQYYRAADVLLLDDVHTLAGKERTQEEVFSIFNILYQAQKQIVLTADQPPQALAHLEGRLVSRFSWGLVADIQPPELETRIAILHKKAMLIGVHVPDDVALFIAERVIDNVRTLEGALRRLVFLASMKSQPLSIELAREAITPLLESLSRVASGPASGPTSTRISIQDVIRAVATYFKLSPEEIVSRTNRPQVVYPRQIAMYLARHHLEASLNEIGQAFGGKHHTTVMYAIHKIEENLPSDTRLQQDLHGVLQILRLSSE